MKSRRAEQDDGDRDLWNDADLTRRGYGSRTAIWRRERIDPTWPKPRQVPGLGKRYIPEEIKAWRQTLPAADEGQAA